MIFYLKDYPAICHAPEVNSETPVAQLELVCSVHYQSVTPSRWCSCVFLANRTLVIMNHIQVAGLLLWISFNTINAGSLSIGK